MKILWDYAIARVPASGASYPEVRQRGIRFSGRAGLRKRDTTLNG